MIDFITIIGIATAMAVVFIFTYLFLRSYQLKASNKTKLTKYTLMLLFGIIIINELLAIHLFFIAIFTETNVDIIHTAYKIRELATTVSLIICGFLFIKLGE